VVGSRLLFRERTGDEAGTGKGVSFQESSHSSPRRMSRWAFWGISGLTLNLAALLGYEVPKLRGIILMSLKASRDEP
jgi:hypothetical protein